MKKNIWTKYHETRAKILLENFDIAWAILLFIGIIGMIVNLFYPSGFLKGIMVGFLISSMILPLVNLCLYHPKVKRLLKEIGKELRE